MKSFSMLVCVLVVVNALTSGVPPLQHSIRYPQWNPSGAHYPLRRR